MYRVIFYSGSEIAEVWEFNDPVLTSHRVKMLFNNLSQWHGDLADNKCEVITFAIEKNDHVVITCCETLENGCIRRTVGDFTHHYLKIYERVYGLGGVK